jgi:hypothetical protein
MANTDDGESWDETVPTSSSDASGACDEILGLRVGINTRIKKEHAALVEITGDGSTGGGEHKSGSAVAFRTAGHTQSLRPDGVTALAAGDAGRLLIDTSAGQKLYGWDGTTWQALLASHGIEAVNLAEPYTAMPTVPADSTVTLRDVRKGLDDPTWYTYRTGRGGAFTLTAGTYVLFGYATSYGIGENRVYLGVRARAATTWTSQLDSNVFSSLAGSEKFYGSGSFFCALTVSASDASDNEFGLVMYTTNKATTGATFGRSNSTVANARLLIVKVS